MENLNKNNIHNELEEMKEFIIYNFKTLYLDLKNELSGIFAHDEDFIEKIYNILLFELNDLLDKLIYTINNKEENEYLILNNFNLSEIELLFNDYFENHEVYYYNKSLEEKVIADKLIVNNYKKFIKYYENIFLCSFYQLLGYSNALMYNSEKNKYDFKKFNKEYINIKK